MLQNRIIPCLLVRNDKLVKTVKFRNPHYIGDPVNAIKIFNEKEVDELIVVDISENRAQRGPNFRLIREIADECFMPVCYGGGISTIEHIREILKIGIEKIVLNSAIYKNRLLIQQAARLYGNQCIVVAVDIKKNIWGNYKVTFGSGSKTIDTGLTTYIKELEELGAGELLINDISREGTWEGFDIELLKKVTSNVNIPVIAMGGAGNMEHIIAAISQGQASAIAIGSMAVYQNKGMGVLINFPKKELLETVNNL
jgi:imidazole glycerol-phosphate synthase subunit HisF